MFEKAARLKLRFDSPKGQLTVEDLWDLPLTVGQLGGASLDNIAKALNRKIKETAEESFVIKDAKSVNFLNTYTQLRFDIVKHIIDVRLAENDVAAAAHAKKIQKQKILGILAQKKDEQLQGASVEDLEKMLEAL